MAFTFTKTLKKQTINWATETITAPCHSPTFYLCSSEHGHKREALPVKRPRRGHLDRRDPNVAGMAGGPLTTTITPSMVVETNTAATFTSLITITTDAPDATTTVDNPTPTLTIFDGVAVTDSTSTLPQETRTKKRYSWTVTTTTATQTLTLTRIVKTTQPCVT
jgi:hypothetical protein